MFKLMHNEPLRSWASDCEVYNRVLKSLRLMVKFHDLRENSREEGTTVQALNLPVFGFS